MPPPSKTSKKPFHGSHGHLKENGTAHLYECPPQLYTKELQKKANRGRERRGGRPEPTKV